MHTDADVHLQLENAVGEIAPMLDRIGALLAGSGVHENVVFRLRFVLDELLTNTIMYGFPEGGKHAIAIALAVRGDDVRIVVIDDGVPFDPVQRADPDVTAPLEERPIGGLGIYLARRLVPTLAYRREGGRNVVELTSPRNGEDLTAPAP